MVLEAYVDDSGSGHGNVAVLAGFISTAERWKLFSDSLEYLCEQAPRTPDFKMERANSFRAYYWAKREDLDKRIENVVGIIREHAMYRVDVVMSRPDYDAIVKGRIDPKIDSPYFLMFYVAMLSTGNFMDKAGLEGTVSFVFDEQNDLGRACAKLYYEIKKRLPEGISGRVGGEPIFKHDKDILPLKAADVLAWQLRRHLDMEQPQSTPHNEIVDQILAMYGVSCQIRPADLRAFIRDAAHGLMFKGHCLYHMPQAPSA